MKHYKGPVKVGETELTLQGQEVEGLVYKADYSAGHINIMVPFGVDKTTKELLEIDNITKEQLIQIFADELGINVTVEVTETEINIQEDDDDDLCYDRDDREFTDMRLVDSYNFSMDLLKAVIQFCEQRHEVEEE